MLQLWTTALEPSVCELKCSWFSERLGTRLGCTYKLDDMTPTPWITQETFSLYFCILQAIKTGQEGLGTRLDTRCLPAFSIHLISCRSRCRSKLNKPTDMVGCYSVQHFREWRVCEENRWYMASWCVPPYAAVQSLFVQARITISFCMAHRVPNK